MKERIERFRELVNEIDISRYKQNVFDPAMQLNKIAS